MGPADLPLRTLTCLLLSAVVGCGPAGPSTSAGDIPQEPTAAHVPTPAEPSAVDDAPVLLLAARWSGRLGDPDPAPAHLVLYEDGVLVRVLPDGSRGGTRLDALELADVRQRLGAAGLTGLPARVDGLSATMPDAGSVLLHSTVLDATTSVHGFESLTNDPPAAVTDPDTFAPGQALGAAAPAVTELRRLVEELAARPLSASAPERTRPAPDVDDLLASLSD